MVYYSTVEIQLATELESYNPDFTEFESVMSQNGFKVELLICESSHNLRIPFFQCRFDSRLTAYQL